MEEIRGERKDYQCYQICNPISRLNLLLFQTEIRSTIAHSGCPFNPLFFLLNNYPLFVQIRNKKNRIKFNTFYCIFCKFLQKFHAIRQSTLFVSVCPIFGPFWCIFAHLACTLLFLGSEILYRMMFVVMTVCMSLCPSVIPAL